VHRVLFGWLFFALSAGCFVSTASAQTTVNGSALALRSYLSGTSQQNFGADNGTDAVLNTNGYVGTYFTLASPTTVTLTVNARSQTSDATQPELGIAVDNSLTQFSVGSGGFGNYTANVALPAGTHFVRLQYDNDLDSDPINANNHSLTVHNLQVIGATVSNSSTDANALAAANDYINTYRKGPVTLRLVGVPASTSVDVKMTSSAFNFGGTVSGTGPSVTDSKNMLNVTNPAPGTQQYYFQQFINSNFNTIVPSNGGKWAYNEGTQNSVTMQLVDQQLNYSQSHNMKSRMHNLIWGSGATSGNQQPSWVNSLISSAAGGNATAKANLSTAITNRINYYVGTNGNRSQKYVEVDVLNEAQHNPSYWNIFGPSGIASIYNQVDNAIAATGSQARTYLNEYNVLQSSPLSIDSTGAESMARDQYGNWYRNEVEAVNNAGIAAGYGKKVVTGIGMQLYASTSTSLSTATMQKALQNYSIEGLPLSMAEFGISTYPTAPPRATIDSVGPDILENAMRMIYGSPQATTFMMWGWWDLPTNAYPPAALLDNANNNAALTTMGTRWEWLFGTATDPSKGANATNPSPFPAIDQLLTTGSGAAVNFVGGYGDDYKVTIGGNSYALNVSQGKSQYAILVNPTLGDMDLDGKRTNADLQAALLALADPSGYEGATGLSATDLVTLGDANGDHAFDAGDLGALISLLAGASAGGGAATPVPEPPAMILLALGATVLALAVSSRRNGSKTGVVCRSY